MELDEIIPLVILNTIFGGVAIYVAGILVAIPTCIVMSYITLLIIRFFKYSQRAGIYQISPFACHIFDDKGLLASFKGSDWWAVEEPVELTTTKATIKTIDETTGEMKDQNEMLDVNYQKVYEETLDLLLKTIIPDPPNPNSGNTTEVTLDDTVKNVKDHKLLEKYNNLGLEEKKFVAQIGRALLFKELGESFPKLYQVASLSNEVFIYWFAQGQPAEYFTYRSKQFFRKWKIIPWFRGFPVIEMWGAEIREKREVVGKVLRCLICMPIQDENVRREKTLNMKKYSIIASALTTYTTTILKALPYLAFFDLIKTERDRYKEESEVYKKGMMSIYADISSVSNLFFSAMSLLSKVGGAISAMPSVPKEITKELEELVPAMKAEATKFGKIKEAVTKLTSEEAEKKEKLSAPPKTETPTTPPEE